MRRFLLPICFLALAQCSGPEPTPKPAAPPPPAPAPAPQPAPATAGPWEDAALTRGDWIYRRDERGSVALFGQPGVDAAFLVRCTTATKRVYVSRQATAAGDGRLTLRATSGLKSYAASISNDAPLYVSAELAASDPQLDALAYSRGRFLIGLPGSPDLIIPAWPELARVVEDCRS